MGNLALAQDDPVTLAERGEQVFFPDAERA